MSDAFPEFDGTLDLTGADESAGLGFEPAPSGRYECFIDEGTEWRQTSGGPQAQLPEGTWYLAVWWRCDEEEPRKLGEELITVKNKVFFQNLFVPPPEHDATKAATMKGNMLNFLLAIGYTKEEINKKGFRVNPDNLYGKRGTVIVRRKRNKQTNEWENQVQGVKAAGSGDASTSSAGALI